MSNTVYCLVSRIAKLIPPVDGEIETNRIQIITCSLNDADRKIGVYEGWSPHDNGGESSPSEFLNRSWTRIFLKDGHYRYETEEREVWFKRECESLDCPWFSAMVRRMASGEVVKFHEIEEAYRNHHNSEKIPTGAWWELEKAWEALSSRAKWRDGNYGGPAGPPYR